VLEGRAMEIIQALEATRNETIESFALGDLDLERSYGTGKWSVRFILHHLADARPFSSIAFVAC
jgi:hypothetical protein